MQSHATIRVDREDKLADETFEITGILENRETGRRWLRLELPNRNIIKKVGCSPRQILAALTDLGVIVLDKKALIEHLTRELFENKPRLQVTSIKPGSDDETSVYEEFIRFVWQNLAELQKEDNLTKISYSPDGKRITVTINVSTMRRDFFARTAGIHDRETQDAILRYWREEGWLETQASQDQDGRLSVVASFSTRAGKKYARAFKITVPTEGLDYAAFENRKNREQISLAET